MDLQTVVAVSMLSASRAAVAAAFSTALGEARFAGRTAHAVLTHVWTAAGRRDALSRAEADRLLGLAAEALDAAGRLGIQALPLGDPAYPPLLSCISDPPPVLWMRGCAASLSSPAVALIGSRAATDYARAVADRLAGELATRGMVVVSGLARGVDSAAHRACVRAGGRTVAVLGSGVDRIYPAEHRVLAEEIAAEGAVVSELAPGAPPLPEHFPLRNRIISGLSLATVVVEASERSGSLITARAALEQGRDVMAVPGSILSGRNRGSHGLLKDGAKVVESADDILQDLGWSSTAAAADVSAPVGDAVLDCMDPGETYELDTLAAATGLDASRLLMRLTELELAGRIEGTAGRYRRA